MILALVLAASAVPPGGHGFLRRALGGDGPSLAIIPRQSLPLTFSHKLHLDQGIDCEGCHEDVSKSASSADVNIPREASCAQCHDETREGMAKAGEGAQAKCQICHPGFDMTVQKSPARVELPPPNLKFPHQKHLAKGIRCDTCHANMAEVELATRQQLPRMNIAPKHVPNEASCLSCHDGVQAASSCKTCHLTDPDGKLTQQFASGTLAPSGQLRGDDHGRDWLARHARVARADEAYCMNCHRENECLSCHAQSVQKPFAVHPANFVATHQQAARANLPDCSACHRQQSFCLSCHTRLGAAAASPFTPLGADGKPKFENTGRATFHPPRDVFIERRGPEHHSVQAQRNMNACASCHQEADCIVCHQTTAMEHEGVDPPAGGFRDFNPSPHPPGFKDSCKTQRTRAAGACAKCHLADDARLAACQ